MSVADLRDGLRLSIANLRDSVGLAVGHNTNSSRGDGWLSVRGLCCRWGWARATIDGLDVDLIALVSLLVGVDVVELSAQTLPPDILCTNGKSAVGAEGEASSINGSGLGRSIKLELIVGGNVTSSASLILENTATESEGEGARLLSLLYISFNIRLCLLSLTYLDSLGGGDIHDLNLERSWRIWRASFLVGLRR